MEHLPPLIFDLAIILGAAAISTLIFSKLKQPIVLGYLIAGFAVGPHFPLWPDVLDNQGFKIWAEIGVIFLLFGLGLEFSFKKLAKVGKSAFIAALFEIITMSAVGYLFGRAIGWSTMDSIYLGAILSMSSTTIIIRAFDESGLKSAPFASLVFGILIVEDLFAILIMVVLSALSTPGTFSGTDLMFLSSRLVFFLVLWFAIGIYVIPTVLKRVRRFLSNEIMLIVSISLCFMMVVIATKAHFSAALGAFVMGSILAETQEGERIEHLMVSVKDLFGAVFFVSVGMMINPVVLWQNAGVILMITILTIVGKLLGSGVGAVLSGRSLRQSTQAGMSLAQIGEFSFIIATLGLSLQVISESLYPLVIAVSAVTTFTTPYMIRFSEPAYVWMERRLPQRFLARLAEYERAMNNTGSEAIWMIILRKYGPFILLNTVVTVAITLIFSKVLMKLMIAMFDSHLLVRSIMCILTLVICSPFLYAIVFKNPKKKSAASAAALLRLHRLQFGIVAFRAIGGIILIEVIINQFATTKIIPLMLLIGAPLILYGCRSWIEKLYGRVERRFLENLNAKELADMASLEKIPQLAPWGANLVTITMNSDSPIAGQTLEESQFRTVTGVTVGMIDRGNKRIFAPSRSHRLLPGDQLFLIGVDEQVEKARKLLQPEATPIVTMAHDEMFNLEAFVIEEGSPYCGKIIRAIGLGEEFGGLIVGLERKGERLLNPESSVMLEPDDVVWVFGHTKKIREFRSVAGAPEAPVS